MQDEMRRYADRVRQEKGVPLQIRVGVNTSEVMLRSIRKEDLHTDYLPVGHSTNIASRLESLANPGAIVVSETTYQLIEGYFACKALGAAQVKGVPEPLPIYEVVGVGPLRTRLQVAARRGLSRFVGRQREIEQMQQAWELTKAGHGRIVAVVGEPGVGKSRLLHEFKLRLRKDALVLETFSVSHGKAYAYLPLIDLLKHYFQMTLQDDERSRREKLTGRVLTLDRSLEDTLPYLFFLLGLAEALDVAGRTGERMYEAELYRLKGTLTLQQFKVQSSKFKVEEEAEECFQKAIEVARKQQAKSLELRAVMSLSRLWQQQGKTKKARQMLVEIYGWFTEGFDTADLQEAKALLEELAGEAIVRLC